MDEHTRARDTSCVHCIIFSVSPRGGKVEVYFNYNFRLNMSWYQLYGLPVSVGPLSKLSRSIMEIWRVQFDYVC